MSNNKYLYIVSHRQIFETLVDAEAVQQISLKDLVLQIQTMIAPLANDQSPVTFSDALNITRVGQLKGGAWLSSALANSRTLDKPKLAVTSKEQSSAEIVGVISLIFMAIFNYFSSHNVCVGALYTRGGIILFYVFGNELLGLFIVLLLVKGVRA
ncbi:hypothetical protein [Vibrio sp. Vb339]|uniref:hypothetical protein n=1 Tax=Vibrio sp. Vb339 TaxID=1192013 RepID=UPI00155674CD|nr:hypothetical protein [Vibrio sp. Vb339]